MIFKHEQSFNDLGRAMPWWTGYSYMRMDRGSLIFYPVPFNLLIRWSRDLWDIARRGHHAHDMNIFKKIENDSRN